MADRAEQWRSAYVHIPFCAHRCPYCDFAIVDESATDTPEHQRYIEAVVSEIAMEGPFGRLDAVNFGGGTPSLLAAPQLHQVLDALQSQFEFGQNAELSIEVNPEDVTPRYAESLAEVGFTRMSIGAQSFDGAVLGVLGRHHGVGSAAAAVADARAAGFGSVSIDLIYGHSGESVDSWRRTVEQAVDLPVDHISTYALTVERGTALSREVLAGAPGPDGDIQADRYELFSEKSAIAGFTRYEVSNHARDGHACVYNLSTWAHGEYVAFGLGAHDHRRGLRSRNHQRLDRYLDAVEAGSRPRVGSESLSLFEQERDRFMLGLRLAAGTPLSRFGRAFLTTESGVRLLNAGTVEVSAERVIVCDPMLTDTVAREAVSVSLDDC
ncbi:MAG: radical SAM family heme chaperone HemW [Acidimicrobiia bacterium]